MKTGTRQSPLWTFDEISPASVPQGKAPRNENSGLLDLRKMAAIYGEQESHKNDRIGAVFEPVVPRIGTPHALVLPLPPPPDLDAQTRQAARRNRLMWALCGAAGVLGIGAMALAAILVLGAHRNTSHAGAAPAVEPSPKMADATSASVPESGEANLPGPGIDASPAAAAEEAAMAKAEEASPAQAHVEETVARNQQDDRVASRPSREQRRERRERREREPDESTAVSESSAGEKAEERARNACMDEIACELASNPPACCSRYKARQDDSEDLLGERSESLLPERLERTDITEGMGKVHGSVMACRAGHPVRGQVKVSIKVNGEGKVQEVRVREAPTQGLGSCVASKVSQARFQKTQRGATFSYPFVF